MKSIILILIYVFLYVKICSSNDDEVLIPLSSYNNSDGFQNHRRLLEVRTINGVRYSVRRVPKGRAGENFRGEDAPIHHAHKTRSIGQPQRQPQRQPEPEPKPESQPESQPQLPAESAPSPPPGSPTASPTTKRKKVVKYLFDHSRLGTSDYNKVKIILTSSIIMNANHQYHFIRKQKSYHWLLKIMNYQKLRIDKGFYVYPL